MDNEYVSSAEYNKYIFMTDLTFPSSDNCNFFIWVCADVLVGVHVSVCSFACEKN